MADTEAGHADYVAEPGHAQLAAVARRFRPAVRRAAPPLLRDAAPRHRRTGLQHPARPVHQPAVTPGSQLRGRPAGPRRSARRPPRRQLPAARHARPASGMSTRSLAPISRTGRAILAVCSNASCAELGRSSKQTSSASDYTYSYGPTPEPSHPRRADQAREISSMRVMTPSGELRGWSSTLAVTT